MIRTFFHAWERRLASATTDRVVRPFEWGVDWIPGNGGRSDAPPAAILRDWVAHVMEDTDAFFTPAPTSEYTFVPQDDGGVLTFPSALTTPHAENNTVYARLFHARGNRATSEQRPTGDQRRWTSDKPPTSDKRPSTGDTRLTSDQRLATSDSVVLVLPQWNSSPDGHVGLCRLIAMNGMTALRLSLPYHDRRMPPELHRADYIVSSNVARTVQVCRQAVLDARLAIRWLASQGFDRIGILGSSLGSCLALLTTAHEPLIRAQALNHISPYFADVVWRGLSTRHVREGLDGHIDLDLLRALWAPISPRSYLERVRDRKTLLLYAHYDLTFPVDLSRDLVRAFAELGIPHEVATLRCGHYTTGKTPFKYLNGWILTRFLKRSLTRTVG